MRLVELEPGEATVDPEAVEAVLASTAEDDDFPQTRVILRSGVKLTVGAAYSDVLRKLSPERCQACVQEHRPNCPHARP